MRVWIVQTGEPMPIDHAGSRPMRAMNLSAALVEAGHSVTLWTADFNHFVLGHRFGKNTKVRVSENLELRFVRSPGYSGNHSVSRLFDHAMLARELKRLLKHERSLPDVAFIGFPPIEPAVVMVDWLNRRGVPTVVDVKDAWPDVLERAIPVPLRQAGRVALTPYRVAAKRVLRDASALSSTTNEFLDWTVSMAGRPRRDEDMVFPLTSPLAAMHQDGEASADDWLDSIGVPASRVLRVAFVGAVHSSYDFEPVAKAARARPNVQFVICGDGSRFDHTVSLFRGVSNVVMPGWVSTVQADALARRSDLALIPIAPHPDFLLNVSNKFYDAISKGLPVLVGLEGALGRLVRQNDVGWVYGGPDGVTLESALREIEDNPGLVREKAQKALELFQRDFDFDRAYSEAVGRLEELALRRGAEQAPPFLDKLVERRRYDHRAKQELQQLASGAQLAAAVDDQEEVFQPPYRAYEEAFRRIVRPGMDVLELGAGSGRHTVALTAMPLNVVATDISEQALRLCRARTQRQASVLCCDMETLAVASDSIDVVLCAGSLSYGEPALVEAEILRVLRPGGSVVFVDSLNHNFVYRLNRRVGALVGGRTVSTLRRMPRVERLSAFGSNFASSQLRCFGTFDFAYPVLRRVAGPELATRYCQQLDRRFGGGKHGFKFVFEASGLKKSS